MIQFFRQLINRKNFALHITDNSLRALQLNPTITTPQIHALEHQMLPIGILENGEIIKEKELADEILKFLSVTKPHAIKTRRCLITLPESQTFEHTFYLPIDLKGKDLKKSLDTLVEETIPLPFHELKYDYHISVRGNLQIIFVVAVKRQVLAQYYDVIKTHCRLKPILAEPESLSLLRNIPFGVNSEQAYILIDTKDDNILWFTLWGNDIYDSNLVSFEDFKNHPENFIEDLKGSLDNFQTRANTPISQIFFSGPADKSSTIINSIASIINLPVTTISKYRIIPQINKVTYPNEFKVVAGLALKGLGVDSQTQINLFKK